MNLKDLHDIYLETETLEWKEHSKFKGVFVKRLLTREKNNSNITCLLVKTPKGIDIPEHTHGDSQDIIFPIEGNGKIHIEGIGDFAYVPGAFIVVPKNTPHYVYDVKETLIAFDIFNPATL